MSARTSYTPLPHTTPPLASDATRIEATPDADAIARVTVVTASRTPDEGIDEALQKIAAQLPQERPRPSHEQFFHDYGAREDHLERVEEFARDYDLTIVEASASRRAVVLEGTLSSLSRAFRIEFTRHAHPRREFRSHIGPIQIPSKLDKIVEDVLGLDERPLFRSHATARPALRHTDPRAVAAAYRFPDELTGKGQCVAVIEYGGGYFQSDFRAYFENRGIATPRIRRVELAGQKNDPANAASLRAYAHELGLVPSEGRPPDRQQQTKDTTGAFFWNTVEVSMDVQLIGTLAPDARIVVYYTPDNARGKYDVFTRILSDRRDKPSVISCSWGSCENQTPQHFMRTLDKVFKLAALKGITICASSGDFGDGATECGEASGHFPASSPHVLSCGGTHLQLANGESKETAWRETLGSRTMSSGRGFSAVFAKPSWQEDVRSSLLRQSKFRGYPDVAAKADVVAGYDVLLANMDIPMGGTSAAAPLWASLVARINGKLGVPTGFLTPLLYEPRFAEATRDVTVGTDGGTGWNASTGWGSPDGVVLLERLQGG